MNSAALRPRSRPTPAAWLIVLAGAAGSLLVVAGVVPLPDLDAALEDASDTLGAWTYAAVAGFAFLETGALVGLAVPGETAVVLGGVVAARGDVELVPLIGLVWLAAASGDLVSFMLGRRLGRPFLKRNGPRLRLGPERLARVERFYGRHGGKAVLVGRFAGVVRAVSPFLAGASGLALRRFVPWSAAGALLWATTFVLVGFAFSESFAEAGDVAARIALVAALVAGLGFAAVAALRSGGLRGRGRPHKAQRQQAAQPAQNDAQERSRRHIEREVHAEIDARDGDRGGDGESEGPRRGHSTAIAVAAANAVALWPEGNDGLSGMETSDPSPGSATGGRARSNVSLRTPTASDAAPAATAAAQKASGRRRRHRSEHKPRAINSGPLTHQADSTTKTDVSQGCSKAGAASTARGRGGAEKA